MDSELAGVVSAYLEKADEKLAAARDLLAGGHFQDAVSRAYYAAYHAARAALLVEGERPRTHQGVVSLFGLHLVRSGRVDERLGRLLATLKDDREASDYEAVSWIDREAAQSSVAAGEEIVRAVRRLLGHETK